MQIQENMPLASFTTLRVGGRAVFFVSAKSLEDITQAVAFAQERHVPFTIIGGGSNILASDEGYEGLVIQMAIRGIDIIEETAVSITVRCGAGESWDDLVAWSTERNLWGIENLSGIPGTVGATPVQNVGAYGAEVANAITHVEVIDTRTLQKVTLSGEACVFGYRDSIFKRDNSPYVITAVVMRFSKIPAPRIAYADLATHFSETNFENLSPRVIRDAVISIRSKKFPDLSQIGTAGSFFKNPVISAEHYQTLQQRFPDMPGHQTGDSYKVSLAWVLDRVCNLKGYRAGNVALFDRQPLVLVARAGATAQEIDIFAQNIASRVFDATHITIEREVREIKNKNT